MDLNKLLKKDSGLRRNLLYVGIIVFLLAGMAGAKNVITPNDEVKVGYTEVSTECNGIDAGVCLGFESRTYKTYNYDDYEKPEPGTENFYRKVESELMIRAYNTCDSSMDGYEWTSEVSYRNRTAEEWRQNENVQLLPCEKTFFREMDAPE